MGSGGVGFEGGLWGRGDGALGGSEWDWGGGGKGKGKGRGVLGLGLEVVQWGVCKAFVCTSCLS